MGFMFLPGDLRVWPDDPLDRGLVSAWEMDRDTGGVLPDYSYFANHATLASTGATRPMWINSRYGPGLNFVAVSGQYVDTGVYRVNGTGLFAASTEEFTLEFHARIPNGNTGACIARAVAAGGNRTLQVYYQAGASTPAIYLRGGFTQTNVGLDDGTIHGHWITWDGTTAIFYYDGIPSGVALNVGAAAENTGERILFGARTVGGPTFPLTGDLFGVRIWNRALAAVEVRHRHERWLTRVSGAADVWMIPFLAEAAAVRIPRPPAAYNTLAIY